MRILQIGLSKNFGGVERFVYNYASRLEKENIIFDYVDLHGNGLAEEEMLRAGGSRIYTLKTSLLRPFAAAKQIRKIVREGNYRCVHANMLSAANPVPAIAALQAGAKVIVHSHNARTIGILRKTLHRINLLFVRHLPFVRLACGKAAGEWMYGKQQFTLIPNAIDIEKFRFQETMREQIREKMQISDDALVLGFVGRFSGQKNPAYLVKILQAVKQSTTREVKLLLVGTGELQAEIENAAAALKLEQDVLFAGAQKDTSGWYSAMDVFLLPSLFEGLPFVGIEAQASGLPCFFSDQISEEIKLTDRAHMCKSTESAENWAQAILESTQSTADRGRYSAAVADAGYSIAKCTEVLVAMYNAACK